MSSRAIHDVDSDKKTALASRVSTLARRILKGLAATAMALVVSFALPGGAAAHGCGSADHWSGGPHYYEGRVTFGNSRYTKWYEVNLGSGGFNYTWCGCVNPALPCIV